MNNRIETELQALHIIAKMVMKDGMTENRGFFLNLKNFNSQPIPVGS